MKDQSVTRTGWEKAYLRSHSAGNLCQILTSIDAVDVVAVEVEKGERGLRLPYSSDPVASGTRWR